MTPHGAEDVKDTLQSKHLESLIETGFSEEETAILREYKGTKGKKVIRKVCKDVLRHSRQEPYTD